MLRRNVSRNRSVNDYTAYGRVYHRRALSKIGYPKHVATLLKCVRLRPPGVIECPRDCVNAAFFSVICCALKCDNASRDTGFAPLIISFIRRVTLNLDWIGVRNSIDNDGY